MADIPYNLIAEGWGEGAAAVREFGGALDDASSDADAFAESADEATSGASDFGASLDDLKGLAGTVGGALAAATTAALAWGASVETTVRVFNSMPGSLNAAQQAVGGLVSQMDLAVSRNRLMSGGLELTDQQFADVAEVAVHYAQTIGGDTTQAMEQFGDALQGLSADELARFGLSIDSSKSRSEQFADAMAQLHARAGEMETGAESLGGTWQRLTVILEDAVTEAQRATDVVAQQITSFDDLARAITGSSDAAITWSDVSQTTEDIFVGFVAAVGAGVETMNVAIARAVSGFRSMFDFLREGLREIESGDLDFGAAFQRSLRRFQPVEGTRSLGDIFSNALDRNLTAIVRNPSGGSVPAPSGGLRGGPRGGGGSSAEVDHRTTEERIDDMLGAQEAAEAAQRAMEDEARAARIALSETRNALDAWSAGLDKAAEASAHAREEQARLAEQQKELNDAARDASLTFRDSWRDGVDAVIQAFNEANDAAAKAGTAQISIMEGAAQAALAASKTMGDALLGGVANAFAGAAKAAVMGQKSFGEALAQMLEDTLFSIGSQAIVLSIFEFARAIGDAASLNAAGAAMHAAAGAAYAAVAALAFAGGAGLAAAGGGAGAGAGAGGGGVSAPANPQPANDNGSSGGTTIINVTFGGQVITASTHAELGRQVSSAIGQADARWGRAA